MIQIYTLGFIFEETGKQVLLSPMKNNNVGLMGRLNGFGGKVQVHSKGSIIVENLSDKVLETTNISARLTDWKDVAVLDFPTAKVFVMTTKGAGSIELINHVKSDGNWMSLEELARVPNLAVSPDLMSLVSLSSLALTYQHLEHVTIKMKNYEL